MNSNSIKLLAVFTHKNIRYLMIKGVRLDIIRAELSSLEMTELNRVWPLISPLRYPYPTRLPLLPKLWTLRDRPTAWGLTTEQAHQKDASDNTFITDD